MVLKYKGGISGGKLKKYLTNCDDNLGNLSIHPPLANISWD